MILNGRPFGLTVTRMKSSKSIVDEVASNPNAIGLVGLSWLHSREGDVMVCRLGGGTYRPVMRVRAAIEGTKENIQQIVVTDIPFQRDRISFVAQLRESIQNQTLKNITDVRDESEGNKTRIILSLKPQVDANEVLGTLDRQTQVVDTTLVAGQFFSPAQAHVLRKYYPIWREVYLYTREPRRDVSYGFIAYV
jgi:DNA gyrase subunit A